MPFTLPPTTKPVSIATAKIYKTYLNRLSDLEIDNIQKILENPYDTVVAIDLLTLLFDDEEERKRESRLYYCAVFFVLYGQPILQEPDNELRKGFVKNNPSVIKDGVAWKPKYS